MNSIELIKKMSLIHCARGTQYCKKCKQLKEKGEKFCLIRVYLNPGSIARPITEIYIDGNKIFGEYDVLKIFDNESEAKEHAKQNSIEIIIE